MGARVPPVNNVHGQDAHPTSLGDSDGLRLEAALCYYVVRGNCSGLLVFCSPTLQGWLFASNCSGPLLILLPLPPPRSGGWERWPEGPVRGAEQLPLPGLKPWTTGRVVFEVFRFFFEVLDFLFEVILYGLWQTAKNIIKLRNMSF